MTSTPSNSRERWITIFVITVTLVINGIILALLFMPQLGNSEQDYTFLPRFNAILNGCTFVFLTLALIMIKRKNIVWHRRFIFAAFTSTSLFLVSYLAYHSLSESTPYGGSGASAAVYFFILITHIVLAAVVVPLALLTLIRGLQMRVPAHRKIARWTMPIWLYVSLTGVIVYLMISPYYGAA